MFIYILLLINVQLTFYSKAFILLATINYIVILNIIIFRKKHIKSYIFDARLIFLIFNYLYFYFSPSLYELVKGLPEIYIKYQEKIHIIQYIATLGMLFTFMLNKMKIYKKVIINKLKKKRYKNTNLHLIILLLIYFVVCIYMFRQGSYFIIGNADTKRFFMRTGKGLINLFIVNIFPFYLLVLLYRNTKHLKFSFIFPVLVFSLFQFILTGSRSSLITLPLIFLLDYMNGIENTKKIIKISLMIFFSILGIFVLGVLRGNNTVTLNNILTTIAWGFIGSLGEIVPMGFGMDLVIKKGFNYGSPLQDIILYYVPRSIWLTKPIQFGFTRDVSQHMGSFIITRVPSLTVTLYSFFGSLSVFLGYVVLLVFLDKIYNKFLKEQDNSVYKYLYYILLISTPSLSRGDVSGTIRVYILQFMLYIFINSILIKEEKVNLNEHRY